MRESSVQIFTDTPIDGPPTALDLAKHQERFGGDPRRWLSSWAHDKKLDQGDRNMHELRCLTDILHYAGTVDQLNLGGLVCLEILARRIQLMTDALQVPMRPNWEAAKYFAGLPSADDVVSPSLRTYVARKAKDESEIFNARSRARELRIGTAGGGGAGGWGVVENAGAETAGVAAAAAEAGGLPAKGGKRRGARVRGVPPAGPQQ